MNLTITLILMTSAAAVFGLSAWRAGRPWNPVRGPRMIPWTVIAILAGAMFLLLLAHLYSFAGIETGRGLRRF